MAAIDHKGEVHTGLPSGLADVPAGHPALETFDGLPAKPSPVSTSDVRAGNEDLKQNYQDRMQKYIDAGELTVDGLAKAARLRN